MKLNFNSDKFKKELEKKIKDGLAKTMKKDLEKKGVKNIKQVGSKGILPKFTGDMPDVNESKLTTDLNDTGFSDSGV